MPFKMSVHDRFLGVKWYCEKVFEAGIGYAGARWAGGTIYERGASGVNQKQFYLSRTWRRARAAYIAERKAIDGGICEVCGVEPGLIVHHVVWLDDVNCNDPSISLNPRLFKYECQTCHNREVDPRKDAPGRCKYGPNGEIIRNTEW